jgi:hypothetical protein
VRRIAVELQRELGFEVVARGNWVVNVNSYESLRSVCDAKENRVVYFATCEAELVNEIGAGGVVPDRPSLLEAVKCLVQFPDVSLARRCY